MVDEANVTMDTIRRKTVLSGCSGFMIATDDGSTRQQNGCALFLSARIHKNREMVYITNIDTEIEHSNRNQRQYPVTHTSQRKHQTNSVLEKDSAV